ncbi:alpha/beta hydrolase [Gordonia sp. DT101]|uniref:alpha/beta hydrolase n=1 Tax=Gordonia sp. DT101 TaxID=3416545 RepID=UPI003CEE236C
MDTRWGPRWGAWVSAAATVAVALTLGSAAASAAPEPDPAVSRIDTVIHDNKQQATAIVYSASMRRMVPITVLRPRDTSKPRPTFYLLNGAGGGEDSATWAAKTDYVKFFADKNVNVVTPIGGAFSYYTDWRHDDPVLGRNKWQTFLTKELPPLIDKEFGTTKVNAIAGISMAGTSVLNLAIAAPHLYRSVAAYSGCARTSDPVGQAYIRMVVADRGQGNLDNMWGPVGGPGWRENDPFVNAAKLRSTKVYMTSGTGLPGPYDRPEARLVQGNPLTLANQVVLGGVIEAAVNSCTQQMATRLRGLRVPMQTISRPTGTHSWEYWESDLRRTWPMLSADLNRKAAPAKPAARLAH